MIRVTKPFLPPIHEYQRLVQEIWDREYLTNDGPVVRKLEDRLNAYLGTDYISLVTNGTIALQLAIKALELEGEIITTPFSYVATTSSIVWENCTPIFADIDQDTFNISPNNIEKLITKRTSAIIATHVFGNPCEIDTIQQIADKYNLKVIYDAAHCFASQYKEKSIFSYGDISTASFHATKIFHTVEGGAVFSSTEALKTCIDYMRNFGHDGPAKFNGVGINGKNSELHAAMGLTVLNHIDEILETRKRQSEYYTQKLSNLPIHFQRINEDADQFNYAYFPIVLKKEGIINNVIHALEENNIYPRRYFYPSLSELEYVNGHCPVSDYVSEQILCLPLYHTLSMEEQDQIIFTLRTVLS
jgi:dTDP-4-amino-4,6-dideoxygalactose transaminase